MNKTLLAILAFFWSSSPALLQPSRLHVCLECPALVERGQVPTVKVHRHHEHERVADNRTRDELELAGYNGPHHEKAYAQSDQDLPDAQDR